MSDRASSSFRVVADLRFGRRLGAGVVVAHDQFPGGVVAAQQLLQLQPQLAPVGAEFDGVVVDHQTDAPDQLEPLHHRHHVAQRDEVLDLRPRQLPADLVEPGLVSLQGRDGLIGSRQDRRGIGQHVALAADVDGHDVHRVADRDHRVTGLDRGPFRRAVPGSRFVGGYGRVREPAARWPAGCGCRRWTAPRRRPSWPARAAGSARTGRRARSRRRRWPRRSRRCRARSVRRYGRAGCAPGRRAARYRVPGGRRSHAGSDGSQRVILLRAGR